MTIQFTRNARPLCLGRTKPGVKTALFVVAILVLLPGALLLANDDGPFLPDQVRSASTIPANGDVNPYGVAFVPPHFRAGGSATPGNILVSNFNDSANLQGIGTTIVDIPPGGPATLFFQGQAGSPQH